MSENEIILEMIAEGKISVNDGERLLKAIQGNTQTEPPISKVNQSIIKPDDQKPNEGNIVIEIISEDGELVKLNLPMSFAGFMINMLPKEKISDYEIDGINLQEIFKNIPKMSNGKDREILNISTEDGASIKVYVKYQ